MCKPDYYSKIVKALDKNTAIIHETEDRGYPEFSIYLKSLGETVLSHLGGNACIDDEVLPMTKAEHRSVEGILMVMKERQDKAKRDRVLSIFEGE